MHQNYIMSIKKSILINKSFFQVLKRESWVIIMIVLIYILLMTIIIVTGLKAKNQPIRQEKVIKNNMTYHN